MQGGVAIAAPRAAGPDADAQLDERALVRRACEGDQRAMQAIYRRHLPLIKRKLTALVGADAELDDLIQATFVRSFRQLGTFRGDARLSTWLCRIAINVGYSHLASAKRRRRRQTVEIGAAPVADPSPPADELLARGERSAALYRILARVKPANRVVFTLFEIEGHTIDEIAETLGIGRNTVAARLRRTRKAVTRSLRQVNLGWRHELGRTGSGDSDQHAAGGTRDE